MNTITDLKALNIGEIETEVDLKKYTSYKLNEKAFAIAFPTDIDKLKKLLEYLKAKNIKHRVIGNGSNVIFTKYYDGVLIKLNNLKKMVIDGNEVTAEAGYSLAKLAAEVAKEALSGLEFAAGIPGTVGGAVYMNAGAYKSDMGYIVKEAKLLDPNLNIITMQNKELDFHYRTSFLLKNKDYICLEAKLKLKHGDKKEILELMLDRQKRRMETQPIDKPCAGSVFRNPTNDSAWRIIESLGYKGKEKKGAMVSKKHANFIINNGNAKGQDIKDLILEIHEKVKKEYGLDLKIEQEFIE